MSQSLEFKIPEGYVFDKDNSTDEVIRFKPKKIPYKDICRELFLDKHSWRLTDLGICKYSKCTPSANIHHSTISTSRQQLEQLLALNKLMNTAKYLNGDWKPDWDDEYENKFYIYCLFGKLSICQKQRANHGCVAFESDELAKQAIEILGEEEVKKALGIFE